MNASLSLAFSFVFWPLGIFFGHRALADIKRTGERGGRGLAVAGLVLSYVLCVATVLLLLSLAISSGPKEPGVTHPAPAQAGLSVMTTDQVAANLGEALGASGTFQGASLGSPTCDAPLNAVGDVSICTLEITGTNANGDDLAGHWSFTMSLVDTNGHFQWNFNGPPTK